MEKSLIKKVGLFFVALVAALCMIIGAIFGVRANLVESGETLVAGVVNASSNGEGSRVTMLDLMGRYPIDYVLGPLATKATEGDNIGKYVDSNGNVLLDKNGEETNNTYGIPRKQYFDVESYIYTTGTKDSAEGRTLYGWKPNICGVDPVGNPDSIAEDGTITHGSSAEGKTGIYVTFKSGQRYGTTTKYALIVPKDITAIGQGSAAFVGTDANGVQTTYYNGTKSEGGSTLKTDKSNGKATAAYTDFSCFIMSTSIDYAGAPYFWQPRERLAGVYFPEDSRLQTIEGSADGYDTIAETESNRTSSDDIGKSAFLGCDNLRFLVLPGKNDSAGTSGLKTIGKNAFFCCGKIVDLNIPSSVTNLGTKAFAELGELLHLTIPNIANVETDAFDGCGKLKSIVDVGGKFGGQFSGYISYVTSKASNPNNVIYIFGGDPTKDSSGNLVNDSGLYGFVFVRNGSSWQAVALAGATGEDASKVFVFPSGADFKEDSDRRIDVKYDYLDCDGEKRFSTLSNVNVTSYEIADSFAEDTWCQNIVMPKEVTRIGKRAFYNSYVRYLETYATEIDKEAFGYNSNGAGVQWYYFHATTEDPTYNVTSDAFVKATGTRHVVFESKTLWQNVSMTSDLHISTDNTTQHYLIPIIANVNNEDDDAVTINTDDMTDHFFYDSDYVGNPVIIKGNNNKITYTKRLSGYDFTLTKQFNGQWIVNTALSDTHKSPALSNMSETVWYNSAIYTATTNAGTLYASSSTTTASSSVSSVNIYARNIAKPANIASGDYDGIYKGDYTFGETYTFGATQKTLGDDNDECIDFYTVLGLSDNYTINLTKFTYAGGNADGTSVTTSLHNAGSYSFNIRLNADWGVWSQKYIEDNAEYFTASATVHRKTIDYSTTDNIPLFVNAVGGGVLNGDRTPIYKYNDGWYISQRIDEEPNDTKTISNSFSYYTGNDITIKFNGEVINDDGTSTLQDVNITSRNGLSFANSSEYTASFVFQVKYIPGTNNQYSNYMFYYGDDEDTKYNNVTDDEKGLSMTGKQDNYFRLTKKWYIVVQTNMFVNGAGSKTPYLPLEGDIHYADNISVKVPALLYGNAFGSIDFEIDYTPVSGKTVNIKERATIDSATPTSTLAYFINSSMPAGTYTLRLYGSAVAYSEDEEGNEVAAKNDGTDKTYTAISGEYVINISPKAFDETTIDEIHNIMRGNQVANPSAATTELEKYINAYPLAEIADDKKLHESIDALLDSLNDTLTTDRGSGTNYWSDKAEYFDAEVTVGYNREGSGNTVYMSKEAMLDSLATANTYTFYYSISAKNYESIGGADAKDRQERGFRTTLYTAMRLSEIYNRIIDVNDPYFKDVTYTGSAAKTSVPYSQYYSYSFDDVDYVNVGTRTVTLTLNNPELARWETDGNDYSQYFEIVDNGKSLCVYFDIVAADNGWNVMPQMPSWTFNGFDVNINSVTSGLKFSATVKYALIPNTVANPDSIEWGSAADGVAYFTVDDNGMVDGATAAKLNALKPASYYLKFFVSAVYAVDGETINVNAYSDIARNNNGNPLATVTISKAANSWTSTPNVSRWTFGEYDPDLHLITAEALYPALLPKDENGNVIAGFAYTKNGVALTELQSNVKFVVYDGETVVTDFASLHAGTYVLATSMEESDYYTAIAETRMSFTVGKAVNIWTTTPQVVQWTWGEYSADKNVISAEAKFNGGDGSANLTDEPILFSVLQVVNGTRVVVDGLENFSIDANGKIIESAAAEAFANLNAGDYYLRATKKGNNDYTDIIGGATTDILFVVEQAANTWDTQPVITGFVYKQFDADNDFIVGVPRFPLTNKAVYYAIGTAAYANVTTLADFQNVDGTHFTVTDADSIGGITAYISDLTKRTYYFAVFVPAENNYSYLFYTGSFNVSQTNNYWVDATPPDISGWTYGTFEASLFSNGTTVHGTVTYTVRYVVDGNVDETDSGIAKIGNVALENMSYDALKAVLNDLNAGTYSLQATSGSTADYAEAKASKQFVVAKADNAWLTNPSISGWKYDNSIEAAGNKGTVKYENAAITEKYYLTTTDGNGNLMADTSNELSSVKDAGSYAYVLTVADTTNYNGFTTTLFFTVEKDDNGWLTSPAGTYSWTWGDNITVITANIVNAQAHNGEVSYSIVRTDGTYTAPADKSISELLESLPVGKYTITTSVTPDGNHATLMPAEAYVEVFAARLTVTTEPACTGWTWGAADADKIFTDIAVTPAKNSDSVSIVYSVSADGGNSWTENPDADYDYLLNYLRERTVGEYSVRAVVTCANHESVTRIVTFTVSKASFVWSGTQKNVAWDWNGSWQESDGGRDIPEWTATDCQGNAVVLSYTVDDRIYADFDAVKAYLQSNERNAGTYTVKVSATLANHTDAEKSFNVTVNVADNDWVQELNATYTIEYLAWTNADWQDLPIPTAKFGSVVCTYGATTIADINEWIKTRGANAEPYVLVLTVDASAGQYTGLSKQVEITVVGIGSVWSNRDDLLAVSGASDTAASYNFTYGKDVFDTIKNTVVFPIGNATAGNTTYSVYFGDSDTPDKTYTTLSELLAYFTSELTAGSYKIVAHYIPKDESYATLTYTVTVVVAQAEVTWDERLESSYSQTYDSVDVPNPTANEDFATVTVTVKKSGTGVALDMNGMTLADFVRTLDVGTYTITATIEDSENYYVNGARETTSILYIGAIQNAWKNVTSDGKTITAAQWTDGYTWTFTRGDNISVMLPESVIGELTITFNGTPTSIKTLDALNELLNDDNGKSRAAGTYTLRFAVAATDNYNGLVSNCTVVINKKSNDWTQELETITTSGSIDIDDFTMPTAQVYNIAVDGNGDVDLRLFNIVKAGEENSNWYTAENFKLALGDLANGMFTVTVRIGGTAPTTASDSFKKALELYNADYEEISCSCFITLSPAENAWIEKLSDMSWTYGDSVTYKLSEADYGNNNIVYVISGNNSEWIVRTSAYSEDIQTNTLNKLNETLNALLPGTYTITASIVGTDLYAAPIESNFALLTVLKYAASWNTDEDLDAYSLLQMTWQQAQSGFLPVLTVTYKDEHGLDAVSGESTVVWKIGNETLTESVISALNKRGFGTYVVTATYAGDLRNESLSFTATVTIEKAVVLWSEATENAVKQHNWVLNSETNSQLIQPALDNVDDCTVTYTLVKVDSAGILYSGSVWSGTNGLMSVLAAQKAGTYEITATAGGDANYVLPADILYTLTISAQPNRWLQKPDNSITWTYNGNENTPVVFVPEYNADLIVITVGGQAIRYENLMLQLSHLGVGSYSIVAYVPATAEYAELEALTITLTIEHASDSFGTCNVPASWDWDDVSQKTDVNGVAWQTTWNTALKVPVPEVSTIATAIVYSGVTEEFVATLHYYDDATDGVKKVLETDLNALKSKLLGLHVGTYTIEFVVADSANYTGCTVVKTFEVLKVNNSWDGSDGVPKIAGWQYNSSVANPTATPVFGKGTVKFSYAQAGDETENDLINDDTIVEWHETTETAGGTYWLRATVPGTSDYNALVGYYRFSINASQNGWVNNPGVIAWAWNGYNKTVNLFSGSAKNNGTATFKIYAVTSGTNNRNLKADDFSANGVTLDKTEAWIVNQFCTTGFTLVNENNVMVVSADVAKYLNALKPGTYVLSVSIAGDNNYDSLSGSATFAVSKAVNSWVTGKAPAVSSYTYGSYNNTTSFTYGETVYGNASAVTYKLDDELFVSTEGKAAYQKLQERLANLDAGSYTLYAWVAESSDGTYSALYSAESPYTSRTFTVARATNGWTTTPIQQVNKAYADLHDAQFDFAAFEAWYAELEPFSESAVNYALLNADYTSRNTDSLTYAQLFNAIKAVPAGEYVIRATVAQTNNYLAIAATDTRLTISTHDNAFTSIPAALSAQWARGDDGKNATVLDDFTVNAAYGQSTITYTLENTTYNSYAQFKEAVKNLDAKSYNVTIAIAATNEYAGLSKVCMLTVVPGSNGWKNNWAADGSLNVKDIEARAGARWAWNSTVEWTRAIPLYGNTVYVEIRQKTTGSELEYTTVEYITIDYGVNNGDNAVKTVGEAISKLGVGNYEMIISAPAGANWAAISEKTEFTVARVTNYWTVEPWLNGATNNKWQYGDTVVPDAESKYGVVRYEYATKAGKKLSAMPTTAGEYTIKFIVDGSTNYGGIDKSIAVQIEKADNRGFSVALGAIGWTWGAYDRESNLFKGTPEIAELENATVTFSVGTGTGVDFAALPNLSGFALVNGLVEKDSVVESALRALTGGTSELNNTTQYTLRIHVGETDNYNGFTFDSTFVVTGATNTWTKTPSIVTWSVNHWTSESLPSAMSLYGAPAITIVGEADGVVYFKGAYKKVEGKDELELVVELNDLNLAPAGYYEMRTSVGTVIGQYNIPLTANSRFRIDVKGAGEANHWEEIPNIDGWIANIDGLFNAPSGKPIRGLPNFVFYVRNEDGSRGQKVDASLTNLVVKKGDKYEADIYIPVEPGNYIMVASSNGIPGEDGKSDALKEEEIYLTIGKRPLSFEEELRISTLLYLGERHDWANPTVKPSVEDADVTYVYTNKETGVSSTEMPTEAGVYTVTATLSALYSQSVSMSVDFTVKLSPNGWVSAPNIKDWSEETKGNTPVGAASVGTDQIIYTYVNVKNPNKILTKKPTTEGSYIMYADVNVEGYEPLHAEYRFTIAPAFDTQLVTAAIVLAVIACILAGVVLYFAIRRYKEN
ncbi:MAG: leucine-rich repeat domain-containing protein [Clostridiales bacterium]|nr:leucine-rich repeat domain-containing protein [Clostridiales bacterium]